jgi:hypothetical protein
VLVPPPQADNKVIKAKTHAAMMADGKRECLNRRRVIMGILFSRTELYFIVGRMTFIQTTLKTQTCQGRFVKSLKQVLALAATALALLAPHVAHAEWQKVTTTDSGIIYVDDGTIKRAGPIRSFWSLLDYRTPQKAQRGAYYVSTRTHMEMDCRKEMVHILQFSMHSGPMLTGEIVDSQGVMREWQTIPPDTPLVNLFRFVCGK